MPSEWPEAPLSTLADLSGGFAFKSKDYAPTGRFVLRTLNISDDCSISREDAVYLPEELCPQYSRFELQPHDTLFVMVGATLGKVGFVRQNDLPALLNQNMWLIRAKLEMADPRFIHYAFRHAVKANLGWASGSARDFVRRDDYRNLNVAAPPLPEQRAIAHILGALDDKIELNRRMNETLETMARVLFKSLFVDFDPVRAKAERRNPGLPKPLADLFPNSFQDSELGQIPNGWQVSTVGELTEINARSLGRDDPLDIIDYVEISEVMHGEIANIPRYVRGTEPSRARRRLSHGDTVISTVRPDRGAHFLCLNPAETLIASTGFTVLTPRQGHWAFPYVALTRREVGDELGRLADGGAYPAVRPEAIAGLRVVVPAKREIFVAFEKLAQPLFERSGHNRTETKTLAVLRDTLLPKLISGELRIEAADRFVQRHP